MPGLSTRLHRAIIYLEDHGFSYVKKVEKWNQFSRRREDLWGADVACFSPTQGIALVQVTDDSRFRGDVDRLTADPVVKEWLGSGGRFLVLALDKHGPRGKRKLWTVRQEEIRL
jgi:hypothetical protein